MTKNRTPRHRKFALVARGTLVRRAVSCARSTRAKLLSIAEQGEVVGEASVVESGVLEEVA